MKLPVMPPVKPMLARSVAKIPAGMRYEPKWDGFRAIVFRDGDEVEIGSRNERPMTRYFPEVVDAARAHLPERCVVDGEIVIAREAGLDFEALLARIHPAKSRVMLLAEQTPAWFIAFDLLALGDTSYLDRPYDERRAALVDALASAGPPVYTTPVTDDPARATEWFETFEGAGLDGVMAKPPGGVYAPDQRTLYKIKHTRTADCVVAGFRWHKSGPVVGSLLLGLYDNGRLQHVGVIGAFSAARRKELVEELAPYRTDTAAHPWYGAEGAHDAPPGDGAPTPDRTPRAAETSRWNTGKDLSFEALRPELVVEVGYDHMEGTRFRHTAQFKRWRPDRTPESCTFDQLERPVAYDLDAVLSAGEPVRVPPPAGTPQA